MRREAAREAGRRRWLQGWIDVGEEPPSPFDDMTPADMGFDW